MSKKNLWPKKCGDAGHLLFTGKKKTSLGPISVA